MALDDAGEGFVARLAEQLPEGVSGPVEPGYLEEPRGRLKGRAAALLRPRNVDEVATIVRACAEARVGLVPWGGGTGLVGGQISLDGPVPVLVSLERMNRIRDLDPVGNVMVAEAGVILADLQAAAEQANRLFPLSLASEGTARIGGNLSTNAGGVQVIRYGNARDLCLGLEAVLPDGSVFHGLKRLRKDNTGYDLRHLLIGAEGTLGIITAASLRLFPLPEETATALVVVPSPAAALALLGRVQGALDGMVSAFELLHRNTHAFVATQMPEAPRPFPDPPDWSVLLDVSGSRVAGIGPRLEEVLAAAFEAGEAEDALIAQNKGQAQDFWQVRESASEANRRTGAVASHDISVPVASLPDYIAAAGPRIAAIDPALRINCFGHMGDGNLHYNVFAPAGEAVADWRHLGPRVTGAVHDLAHEMGGSVSAEHGIGRIKTADLARYGDPAKLAAMRAIKAALDPAGIMNPGAVLG